MTPAPMTTLPEVEGPELLRLGTRLRADERLALRRGVNVQIEGSDISLSSEDGESVLEGIDPVRFNAVISKLDGTRTLQDLKTELGPSCGAAFVSDLVKELLHVYIRIVAATARREDRSLIVVDDFLDDPDAVRSEALQSCFEPIRWFSWPGRFSTHVPSNVPDVMKRIERLVGQRLLWRDGPIHGRFRISLAQDGSSRAVGDNVHTDPMSWNGVLCLTPDEYCRGGISFYRHKATGLFGEEARGGDVAKSLGAEEVQARARTLVEEDGGTFENWEEVSRVGLRYNRLILINPGYFHAVNALFGSSMENGRLTQGFSCYTTDDPFRFAPWV